MAPSRGGTQLVPVVHIPSLVATGVPPRASLTLPARLTASKISQHFSKSQLALALVIQKSKPEDLSTSEYCQQLRKRIKPGRGIINNDDHRYVDSAEFWKDQYTSLHLERNALKDRIQLLEEERRLLDEAKQGCGPVDGQVRRVLGSLSEGEYELREALRKRSVPCEGSDDDLCVGDSPEPLPAIKEDHLRLSRSAFRLTQLRSDLRKAMNNPEHADKIEELSTQCNQTLCFLSTAITECSSPLTLTTTTDADAQSLKLFQRLMRQVTICFRACVDALNALYRTILGRKKKAEITQRMILFFQKALGVLQSSSKLQFKKEATRRRQYLPQNASDITEKEYIVNKYLANALAAILHTITWEPSHGNLVEGILFLILNHAGRVLSNAIFHEHITGTKSPGNISSASSHENHHSVRFEARYIIQILHAAVGGVDRTDLIRQIIAGNGNDSADRDTCPGVMASSGYPNLLDKAKRLIQSTLVKGTIGGAELETLRLPVPPEEMVEYSIELPATTERYGPDWFVESVWALVGWDMEI